MMSNGRQVAKLIVAVGSFLVPFMSSSINVALPTIGQEFLVDAILLNWVATSFILASAIFLIPFGKVADLYGRKKIFTGGFLVYMTASILSALSPSVQFLIFSRFFQGVGGAMIFSTGIAIITSVTPEAERGKALGINVAVVYLGQTVGPFIGGVLTQHISWRSLFYINLPFCLLVLVLVTWVLKEEWVEARGEKLNVVSSVLYSTSFFMVIYGISLVPDKGSGSFILSGTLLAILFFCREARVSNPLISIELFKSNRTFTFSNIATLVNFTATFGVLFLLSLYLQYIKMLSPQNAGLMLMVKAVVQGVFSPIAGALSDRFEPRLLASLGMGIIATSLFLLSFIGWETSLLHIILVLVFLGLGIGLFSSPNTNAIMSSVERKDYGISSSTLATMRVSGQLVSMAIVMLIFALRIGRVEITPEHYGAFLSAFRISLLLYCAFCCIGIFTSLARGKVRKELKKPEVRSII